MREDGAILSRRMVNLTGQDLAGGPYTLRHDYDLGDEITSNAATLVTARTLYVPYFSLYLLYSCRFSI